LIFSAKLIDFSGSASSRAASHTRLSRMDSEGLLKQEPPHLWALLAQSREFSLGKTGFMP
jgi:hypothetical protein